MNKVIKVLVLAGLVSTATTGCGQILGIKRMDAWGFKAEFNSGQDFHIGTNGIDSVNDQRGVAPTEYKPSDNHQEERF